MDSWIWQPGYPLVSAAVDGDELVLRQQRFAYDSGTLDADVAPTTWLVPVHVRNGSHRVDRAARGQRGAGAARRPDAPVIVNAGGHGFYRVGYSAALRDRLTSGDTLATLGSLERYNLVDDAWQEVVAGRLAAAEYLTFIEGFHGERELAVWQAIVLGLRGLGRLLDDDAYPAFQARAHALLAPVVAELGDPVEGEDDVRGKLRGLLVAAFAIQGADAATRARAAEWFAEAERGPGSVASRARRRGDVDRRQHRRRGGLRPDARRLPLGRDSPGAAPPPQRARPSSTPKRWSCARASWP